MIVFLDTNIIIDVFSKREPFYKESVKTFEFIINHGHTAYISASMITDLYYILNRQLKDPNFVKEHIKSLLSLVDVADTTVMDIEDALESGMEDFEDGVVSSIAKRYNAMYVITRNVSDFTSSTVKAIKPEEFNNIYK